MTNLFIIIILFIFLVTQKILLLNEESLILLCFIIFVSLNISKLGNFFRESFEVQSNEVKMNLIGSLKKVLVTFQNFTLLSSSSKLFFKKIRAVKSYYKNLTLALSNYILVYSKCLLTTFYFNKLSFLDKAEDQTIKLLMAIIIKQLNLIVKTKSFYTSSIKFSQLLCFTSISVRECIQLIKVRKI